MPNTSIGESISDKFSQARQAVMVALSEFPQVLILESQGSIWVEKLTESGYDVRLDDDGDELTIYAGPYHYHFADPEQAAACFMWMLTPAYRIRVELRNGSTKKAFLERLDGDTVEQLGMFGTLFPLFGRREEVILQNHILPWR